MNRTAILYRFTFLSFLMLLFLSRANAQVFDVDTLMWNGSTDRLLNMVILGDGYLESELDDFENDANNVMVNLFNERPFREYSAYFNMFMIKVPSNESGAAMDPNNLINNYYGSTFWYAGIERLLVPTRTSNIVNVLSHNFPNYDEVIMLVNSTKYGGSGGWLATASMHSSVIELVLHELGHSFGNLADEYWSGGGSERKNMTQETDPALVKWKNWLGDNNIGIYPFTESPTWHRPHQSCKMRYLGYDFCAVCIEGLIEKIYAAVSLRTDYNPKIPIIEDPVFPLDFSVESMNPDPNSISVSWTLNEASVGTGTESFSLAAPDHVPGFDSVIVIVEDTTHLMRIDDPSSDLRSSTMWLIQNTTSLYIDVSPLELTVPPASGDATFDVTSNVNWSVSESADWLTAAKTSPTVLSVNYAENSSFEARIAIITLSGNGVDPQTVNFHQEGVSPVLNVSPAELSVSSASGDTTFNVTSNIDWSVSESADWLAATKTSPSLLTVTYDENTGTGERLAVITLSGSGADPQTVTLEQEGVIIYSVFAEAGTFGISVYPNPAADRIFIRSGSNAVTELKISLYDISGNLLTTATFDKAASTGLQMIDLSPFDTGVYILQISSAKSVCTNRIIKK